MRTIRRVIVLAAGAISLSVAAVGSAAAVGVARPPGSWGRAIGVPGLAALNTGGAADVGTMSCASAGNCAAGGSYFGGHGHHELGFVVSERNGVWGKAIEEPGLAALGGNAVVSSVSCGSAGNCAAGGAWTDPQSGSYRGFAVVERNGVWSPAIEVPGLAALNTGGDAGVDSVSCASAGNCAVGGAYADRHGHEQGFVAAEQNGVWSPAIEVPGLATLNTGGNAEVNSVSCASAGNCTAGGDYADRHGHGQGFVAAEQNGVWSPAIKVPGLATLNTGRDAEVNSVSCASAGNCTAGGNYRDRHSQQGFVADERNGIWGKAIEVPGLGALDKRFAEVDSVSCASAANCAVGGGYFDRHGHYLGFVALERDGRWGKAIEVPGLRDLYAFVTSVSCSPAGNCVVGGGANTDRDGQQAFVAVERDGRWGKAIYVSGLRGLDSGDAVVFSVSCARAGPCAAGGGYTDDRDHDQAFVVSQTR